MTDTSTGGFLPRKLKDNGDGTFTEYVDIGSGSVTVDTSTLATSAKQDTLATEVGATDSASAAADNTTTGLNGLIKRLLAKFTAFTGTAGSSASAVISVQGIASGTALPISGSVTGSVTATLAGIPAALGQTTMSGSTSVVIASDQTRGLTLQTIALGPTASDGTGTFYSAAVAGEVVACVFVPGTLANTTIATLTGETTGQAILTTPAIAATVRYMPRVPTHDSSGVATGALDAPVVVGRVQIVLASGGNAMTGTLYLFVEGGI